MVYVAVWDNRGTILPGKTLPHSYVPWLVMHPKVKAFKLKIRKYTLFMAALFIFVNAYATIGFMLVEDTSFSDALFMGVITISTVGYGEVIPLSDAGRFFAVTCIYIGLLTSGVSVAMVANLFFEGTFRQVFRARAKELRMRKLERHYIVCGYGTTGRGIANELLAQGDKVVVIDQVSRDSKGDLIFMHGDARKDEVLVKAGIKKAAGLATSLTEDADNVFVVLTARALNPDLKIVSRFKDDDTESKLQVAGANHALSPYRMGGHRLAIALTNPPLLEVLDPTFQKSDLKVRFKHVRLPEGSRVAGKMLQESNLREHALGALVVAIIDKQGNTVFNPSSEFPMDHVDQLLVLGDDEQIAALREYLGSADH